MLKFDFSTYTKNYISEDYYKKLDSKKDSIIEKLKGDSMNGWMNLIDEELLNDIVNTANTIKENSDVLVVIGIGGSYMGTYSLDKLFRDYFDDDKFEIVYAGNNISSEYLNSLLYHIKDKDITVNVISKSGNTLEPNLAYTKVMTLMKDKYSEEELKSRIIVTTDKEKGSLREEVNNMGYKSFIVPDNIGGRYSVLTPVSLLPLSTIIDIKSLLEGAKNGLSYLDNAYDYAKARIALFKSHRYVENFVSYEPKMDYFLEWLKQLFGETEGKENKGIFPTSTIYSRDLHSLGQYIQDGTPLLFETVINVDNGEECYINGRDLHEISNIVQKSVTTAHEEHTPNIVIDVDNICEYTVGELIMFMFLSASISGYLFGINPFDQPGVERYKKEVKKNLEKED